MRQPHEPIESNVREESDKPNRGMIKKSIIWYISAKNKIKWFWSSEFVLGSWEQGVNHNVTGTRKCSLQQMLYFMDRQSVIRVHYENWSMSLIIFPMLRYSLRRFFSAAPLPFESVATGWQKLKMFTEQAKMRILTVNSSNFMLVC